MIPRRLIRTVPTDTTADVERWWSQALEMHPGWEAVTYRDPIDPADFPITAPAWSCCTTGAQLAGLIRLEALMHGGGIYLDSDVEVFRPFTPLLDCRMFAAWEDANTIPDAVLGAEQGHPAVAACLELALERITGTSDDWHVGRGAWATGPGVTTTILANRPDVLVLPPSAFYAVHYSEKDRIDCPADPWEWCRHRWAGSWL